MKMVELALYQCNEEVQNDGETDNERKERWWKVGNYKLEVIELHKILKIVCLCE